ncbi:MAG: T9SS type A sorting domain-containing protein, partial [Candidatus Caldarchaeum sp.]
GRTPQTPLRSVEMLQRLVSGQAVAGQRLSRGDTIAFLRGDTFRVVRLEGGTLRYGISFNGSVWRQSGPPILLTAYGSESAPLPVFTGTWRLSDSAQAYIPAGNVIKVVRPFGGHDSLVVLRVFYRGQPLRPARFPNDSMLIITRSACVNALNEDTLFSPGIATLSPAFVEGAYVWASLGSDYSWGCSRALGISGEEMRTLSWGTFTPLRGARFFLEGKKEYIDEPGEWAYDEAGDTLYLYPPQLPFNPGEYEVMVVRVRPTDRHVQDSKAFLLTASYDTIRTDAIQGVRIEHLHFYALGEGIRTAGVSDIIIQKCLFTHSYRPIWNFLAEGLYIRENTFLDNEDCCICIYGRTVQGFQGNPKAMTRRTYVERNLIKRTGLHPRWSWQMLRVDSSRFVREDYSILIGYNIDSVIVRHNRIDSVSQGGIGGNCFYYTQTDWNSTYAGTVPFIVEKNYISNFCMDFSDCGGIKFFSFMKDGIVRDNILVKGENRDKSHLANPGRPFAKGLYSDVSPHDITWDGNTVIGASIGCGNFYGGGAIRNIRVRGNTFYACQRKGMDVVPAAAGAEGCEVVGNLFFLGMQEGGAVNFYDAGGNGRRDTFDVVVNNWYGHPTHAPSYVYRAEDGSVQVMGFRAMREKTPYEQSLFSRWVRWVGFRSWEGAQVRQRYIANPALDPAQALPINTFGRARMQRVSDSPFGGEAYLMWYPDTAQAGIWSGISTRTTEPVYATVLDSHYVYRWTVVWSSNRAKDFTASVSWPRYLHPNTGDTLATTDRFGLPIFHPYMPETLQIRYEPRFRQFWTLPRIELERGDSVWLKLWDFEEIERSSVVSLYEVYPIFINPSDTVARFSLPAGWLYLTLDSMLVWGSVEVQPWKSRILVRLRYDPSIAGLEGYQLQRNHALVYPNPTQGRFTLMVAEPATFRLYDANGQLITQGMVETEHAFSLEALSAGLYILHLSYKGGWMETVRVLYQR